MKDKFRDLIIPDFKMYYKAIVQNQSGKGKRLHI